VPVTLLRHRTTPVDGTAPVLLYRYGSYGITIPADFRTGRLSLVDRGFIYAVADVRGSMAKGYQWYLDGKLDKKGNTFADFVAAGRHLVSLGYTQRGRIVAMGGSAGGLLMGVAVNLDPTLFGGIIAAVPFVDVLNTSVRRKPAAHSAGMARMGQPADRRRRLRSHRSLFSLMIRSVCEPIRPC